VVRVPVRFDAALEAPRAELFVDGTEAVRFALPPAEAARARLLAPHDGAVIAADPDIPMARQNVLVETRGAGCLRLDDAPLGCDRRPYVLPLPAAGRHALTLHAADGRELDRVTFFVRSLPAGRRTH
jgi:penicillin-binding protein 1C